MWLLDRVRLHRELSRSSIWLSPWRLGLLGSGFYGIGARAMIDRRRKS